MLMMTGIDIWEDFVKFVYRKSGLTGKDLWNEVTEIAEILVVKFYIFIFLVFKLLNSKVSLF